MNVLICGKLGAGKDTLAAFFPLLEPASFASPLKKVARMLRTNDLNGAMVTMKQMFKTPPPGMLQDLQSMCLIPRTEEKDRLLLQKLGTDWGRAWDPDVWVNGLYQSLLPDKEYVITDCRFPNEFNRVAGDSGWQRVYVDTADEIRRQRIQLRDGRWDDAWDLHPSEQYIPGFKDQCDAVIDNNGTLEDLAKQAASLKARWLN